MNKIYSIIVLDQTFYFTVCPSNSYKANISNSDCTRCPKNTRSTSDRTECLCNNGYYRSPYDSSAWSPCYGESL